MKFRKIFLITTIFAISIINVYSMKRKIRRNKVPGHKSLMYAEPAQSINQSTLNQIQAKAQLNFIKKKILL